MAKFNFIWDHRDSINANELNNILTSINEPVRCCHVDTGGDYFLLVFYTPDLDVSELEEKWNQLFAISRYHDDFENQFLRAEGYYKVESANELINYLKILEVEDKLDR